MSHRSMTAPKKPSARGLRRVASRDAERLTRDLDRLARLSPGGAPERPIEVDSPAQVEVLARGTPCPLCRGELRVVDHTAETGPTGKRLRVARTECPACGDRRAIYFRLRALS